MKQVDCYWEQLNLGKKTVEVTVDSNDIIDPGLFAELDKKYEYQVFKVNSGNVPANIILCNHGYAMIETQVEVEMKPKDFIFNAPLIEYIEPDVSFIDVTSEEQLQEVIEKITPEMFVSDRIALDPNFGLAYSCRRYCNWIKNSFKNNTTTIFQIMYKNEHVGFEMFRLIDGIFHGDISGIYPGTDNGVGLLTNSAGPMYIRQKGLKVKKIVSAFSANNLPLLPVVNYCRYNFKNYVYVFVKHNEIR